MRQKFNQTIIHALVMRKYLILTSLLLERILTSMNQQWIFPSINRLNHSKNCVLFINIVGFITDTNVDISTLHTD